MKRAVIVVTFLLGCLIGAASSYADDLLNEAAVAHGSQNNQYMAAYADYNNDMKCRLVNAAGEPTGTALTVTTEICRNPSISYDSDSGMFLVAWGEMDSVDYDYAIKFIRVTSDCQLLGSEVTIAAGLTAWPSPKVVYSPNSQRYLVVYTISASIQAQFINSDGSLDGPAFAAIPGDSHIGFSYADSPDLAFDSVNSRFLVVGLIRGAGSPPISIYGAVIDDEDDPSVYAGPFSILDSGTYLYPPALAFDSTNERFLAVWEVYTGSGHELWGQLINTDGSLNGANWKINEDRYVAAANDVAYKEGDDRFLVAWLDDENEPYEIHAQEVNAGGGNYESEFFLASPAHQYNLALAYNPVADNTLLAYGNAPNRAVGFLVTPEVPTADLEVEIAGQDTGRVDDPLTYTITVTNFGSDNATGVVATIGVPAGATFVQAQASQGTTEYAGSTLTCNLGTLESGDEATVTLEINPDETGLITVDSAVTSGVLDPNAANDSDSKDTLISQNFQVSPVRATIGTEIEITGDGFGAKKGKVFLAVPGGKPVALKVLSWNEAGSGVIRALISKAPLSGVYDVTVVPKDSKGATPIIEPDGFEIMEPEITACPGSGAIGQTITITADYLGTKKGKVAIEYTDKGSLKRTSCKVLAWPIDSEEGTVGGEIQCIVPKVPAGAWTLIVQNKVKEDTVAFTVTPNP